MILHKELLEVSEEKLSAPGRKCSMSGTSQAFRNKIYYANRQRTHEEPKIVKRCLDDPCQKSKKWEFKQLRMFTFYLQVDKDFKRWVISNVGEAVGRGAFSYLVGGNGN